MKWVWTPKGWLVALVAVALLAGAAFVNSEVLSNVMLGLGLFVFVTGYARTFVNIRKHNKRVNEDKE